MKKLFISFAALFLLLIFHPQVNAQTCDRVIEQGCLGECGGNGIVKFVAKGAKRTYCVNNTFNNLCGNIESRIAVYIDGQFFIDQIFTNPGTFLNFGAGCGSEVLIQVYVSQTDPEIVCITGGELHYDVGQSIPNGNCAP